MPEISVPDAVGRPWAVVVHFKYASASPRLVSFTHTHWKEGRKNSLLASFAVVASGRLPLVTFSTPAGTNGSDGAAGFGASGARLGVGGGEDSRDVVRRCGTGVGEDAAVVGDPDTHHRRVEEVELRARPVWGEEELARVG